MFRGGCVNILLKKQRNKYKHAALTGLTRLEGTFFYKHIVLTGLRTEGWCLERIRCGWETAPTANRERQSAVSGNSLDGDCNAVGQHPCYGAFWQEMREEKARLGNLDSKGG